MQEITKKNITKKSDKKTLITVLIIGILSMAIGMMCIISLREKIADLVLPDVAKNYYATYDMKSENIAIPLQIEYVINNGKLFSFCQSISSAFVALIFLIFGRKINKKLFIKCDKESLKRIITALEIIVLIFGVFTFTSRVNTDNNIEKYVVEYEYSGYSEQTASFTGNKANVIGYFKQNDLFSKNSLITVYESPSIESLIYSEGNSFEKIFVLLIKNINIINTYSEMMTIILGVYIFILRDYEKKYYDE